MSKIRVLVVLFLAEAGCTIGPLPSETDGAIATVDTEGKDEREGRDTRESGADASGAPDTAGADELAYGLDTRPDAGDTADLSRDSSPVIDLAEDAPGDLPADAATPADTPADAFIVPDGGLDGPQEPGQDSVDLIPPDSPDGADVLPLPDLAADLATDAPAGTPPRITSIEGTGTAAPIAPRTEDLAAWNAHASDRVAASNRISIMNPVLSVTGTNLDNVTLATLEGQSGQGNHQMTIEERTMTNLKLRWPTTLMAGGLFVLSLTAATGTASAQVFFLQGEKGDKGDPGDSVFSCAGNNCSTTKNLSVSGTMNLVGSTVTQTSKLTVNGTIESTYGGVKFPDGTMQATAASAGEAISGTTITATTKFLAADGSASAPSISFTDYPTTGLFRVADTMVVAVAGNAKLRFDTPWATPTVDGGYGLGHPTLRFSDLYSVRINGADIGFSNGWKFREYPMEESDVGRSMEWIRQNANKGIQLLDENGRVVMIFHRDGNIYTEGDMKSLRDPLICE